MKKGLLLLLTFLLFSNKVKAQDNVIPADFNILPPSPVASELGSYSALNNDMHTGKASASINFLSLKSSFINIPISVSYASNGVNLDDIGGNLGINWSLIAGGVITRTVRDQADENSQSYYPESTDPNDPMFLEFLKNAAENDNLDTEPDLFNFNFLGYSGKFVLDPKEEPIILDASIPLRIQFVRQSTEIMFKIYDDSGLEYHFGFDNAYEKTKMNYGGSNCGRNYDMPQTTSWYLNKIIDPNGNEIVFNYETYDYSYISGNKETRYDPQDIGSPCSESCPEIPDTFCDIYMEVSHAVYLTSIISDNNKVIEFDYNTYHARPALLNNIYQKNLKGETDIKYDFEYFDLSDDDRSWLKSIKQLAVDEKLNKVYEFDYYNLENLPQRLSYQKDDYGYYNGATNSSLVPDPDNSNLDFKGSFANRNPNASFSYYGMLKSIIYPTKGTQSFKYEPNTYNKKILNIPPKTDKSFNVTGIGFKDCTDSDYSFTIDEEQDVNLKISGIWSGNPDDPDDPYDQTHKKGFYTIYNDEDNSIVYGTSSIYKDQTFSEDIKLNPGQYRLRIEACSDEFEVTAWLSYYQGESYESYENINFGGNRVKYIKTYDGEKNSYQYFIYAPYDNLARSSGVTRNAPLYLSFFKNSVNCNFAGTTDFCEYAMLSSNSLSNLNQIQGNSIVYRHVISGKSDQFLNTTDPYELLPLLNGFTENEYYIETPTSGNVINGDYSFGSTLNSEVKPTGLLEKSSIYNNENGSFKIIKQIDNNYVIDDRAGDEINGIAVRKRYQNYVNAELSIECKASNSQHQGYWAKVCYANHSHLWVGNPLRTYLNKDKEKAEKSVYCIAPNHDNDVQLVVSNPCYGKENQTIALPGTIDYIDATEYKSKVSWYYLEKSIETTYSDGNELKKVTENHFENAVHRKRSRSIVKVNEDIISENLVKYPYDYIDSYNHETLIEENNIIKPVKITEKRYGEPIDEKLIRYDNKGNLIELDQSEAISQLDYSDEDFESKGVTYFTKNELEYDGNGQLVQNLDYSGTVRKYIWDTHKRVLAEIVQSDDLPIFLENFDEMGIQNKEESFSGTGYKAEDYSVNFSIPADSEQEYIISYYTYSDGDWNHIQEEYTGSKSISADRIDQVSIFPASSQCKFFTYNDKDQIDAIYDTNGKVTFYGYDEFNRLKEIVDQDYNILKTYEYNYKNQNQGSGIN
jgi:YD repeat-containing protein